MERIHVSVRARPLSVEDAKTSPWRISGNSIFTANHSSKFEFDRIFGEECKTREVYEAKTRQLVAAAVAGFNGTVFAYGQTNSGKTHTMRGSVPEPGVIPLAVHDLFCIIQEDVNREFLLRMSYMEIYNEEINDLLVPEHRKLQIHESLERGIFVAGLREEIVTCPEQVLNFMDFGESHRHIGETNMNVYSSRSHTIFRMIIESRDKVEDVDASNVCDAVRVSVLNLVDLAGSERAAKTGAEGLRLKEGSHINKSLMTLGTVIKKLSEGVESQGGHVPYRDSKLTRILQPALGGNANTAIICNITLAQIHADETKSSLKFASRALRVTNCAQVNEILTDAALLKRQKKEIEELRAKLLGSNSVHFEEEILTLRNTLLQSEVEKERIALELQAEKQAQIHRDKRLQEQAKKIENLSCMILNTQKEDIDYDTEQKMNNRRKTWCPTLLPKNRRDVGVFNSYGTTRKLSKAPRNAALNIPFDELGEESIDDQESIEECCIPAPALLNITNRRKAPSTKKSSILANSELSELQAEYENLLLKFETEITAKDVEIECLRKKLANSVHANMWTVSHSTCALPTTKTLTTRESEALVVIKQLEEQIETLEREKSSIQATLKNVVELATEQNRCSNEKFDKEEVIGIFSTDLASEVCEIKSLLQQSGVAVDRLFSVMEDMFLEFSAMLDMFKDFKSSAKQNLNMLDSLCSGQDRIRSCTEAKLNQNETHKRLKTSTEEMEKNIISLGKILHAVDTEKAALSTVRTLSSDPECMSNDLTSTKLELAKSQGDTSRMNSVMDKKEGLCEESDSCVTSFSNEKENLERQLTDALLELEETKASCLAKERALASISDKLEACEAERVSLATDLYEVRHEMKCCIDQNTDLLEKLNFCQKNAEQEKVCSLEEAMEVAHLMKIIDNLENDKRQNERGVSINNKEKARLRLLLRSTQAKLEAATGRYKEATEEMKLMDRKFQLASMELKEKLEIVAKENLNLRTLLLKH